ncbi:Uncharacterized protein Fot_55652 [Forsythia ovata]|uniref:Uncharacterized protein n=1 Tax=Forsythia ovata TaxID=205694 RepID=A0ABD1P427_9LAMI
MIYISRQNRNNISNQPGLDITSEEKEGTRKKTSKIEFQETAIVCLRQSLPLLRQDIASDTFSAAHISNSIKALSPTLTNYRFSRNYGAPSAPKEQKIKVPLTRFSVSGNYVSALYIAAVKANVVDKVESELNTFVEA